MSDADKAVDCAGAGKTSVINTIFRLMELDQGGIYIDDVEVAKLGLAQLRNSMAIIPQVNLTSRPAPLLASPFARVAISVQAFTVCCVEFWECHLL